MARHFQYKETAVFTAMELVHASFRARNGIENNLLKSGGPVKLMRGCLCVSINIGSIFHLSGGSVKSLQASLCQERCRKQFSPLWMSYEPFSRQYVHIEI